VRRCPEVAWTEDQQVRVRYIKEVLGEMGDIEVELRDALNKAGDEVLPQWTHELVGLDPSHRRCIVLDVIEFALGFKPIGVNGAR
jgi:hypothetical protein